MRKIFNKCKKVMKTTAAMTPLVTIGFFGSIAVILLVMEVAVRL